MTLKEYLEKYKISQRQFALRCGLDPIVINRYVHGKRRPSLPMAVKIHKFTNGEVSVFDLAQASTNE
ncbi:hypothetical protein JCM12298_10900 [Desulfothermus naphthae]